MTTDRWAPPDLQGLVAVVTGASRGIGRGIAEVLAECGAKTYLVARSADAPASPGRSGTLAEVAEAIHAKGGRAVVAPCDLTDDSDVEALFERVGSEEGHLEILVNNAVGWSDHEQMSTAAEPSDPGPPEFMYQPPWHAPSYWWDDNFSVGVRSHWRVTNAAAPLLIKTRSGAVFFTSERRPDEPGAQELVLDLRATVVERMARLFSLHFRPHGVASILLYPGFVRTEAIQRSFEAGSSYFRGWSEDDFHSRTASIHYAGRAAAALAADPNLLDRTGTLVTSHEAANTYGFTDTTGAMPDPR